MFKNKVSERIRNIQEKNIQGKYIPNGDFRRLEEEISEYIQSCQAEYEAREKEILEEIKLTLQQGINRNKVLPLCWAMDRIEQIIKSKNHNEQTISKDEKETI